MIISRTPFRISFFGGGTDYPVWYKQHGGAVLATTIDKYSYISCRYLPPFFDHRSRVAYSRIENVVSNHDVEHPSVRETLKFTGVHEGVEIHHDGDLPARTGLGSSSSFTVGLLHALYALKHRMPTKMQLALEAIHIERHRIGESVGSQDQVSAAFGGFNKVIFTPNDEITLRPVVLNPLRMLALQDHLMLYFTGFARFASQIAEKQIKNTNNKKNELFAIQEMVDEALGILTGDEDICQFGKLLDESWKLKRSLTEYISTSQIDEIYEAAIGAGAIGGKLLGAGGGGFMLIFAKPEDQGRIKEKLKKLLLVPFRFENSGSQIIFYDHNACIQNHHSHEPNASALAKTRLLWEEELPTQ